MQKKPQKNQPIKNKIVDQQNEPFLKTISKRVRNINKKLTQISQLKGKADLKPEQIQKLNRKVQYEQQRARLQNIADFFREVYAENAEHYKNNQLQQLDSLANAIAILRSNTQFKESDKLSDLNKAITQPSNLSIAESAKNISEVLRRFATDYKLKKSLSTFVQQNQIEKVQQVKTVSQSVQQVEPPKKVQTVQELTKPVIQQQKPAQIAQPVKQSPVQQKKEQNPVEQQTQISQTKPIESQQKPVQEKKYRGDRPKGEYRPRNNNRNRNYNKQGQQQGQQQGNQRRRYQNNGERKPRPNYKPKQENRQDNQSDSDSSLEREAQTRNFNKQQIRKLQDDGFTVIGKPKPKAHDQKQWHDHTHGKKAHHHHRKQNN